MRMRAGEVKSISEARARLAELAEPVVNQDTDVLLTIDGARTVASVDACRLDSPHALEAEHPAFVLVQGAIEGLEDLAAGRVFNEAELDRELAALPVPEPRNSR